MNGDWKLGDEATTAILNQYNIKWANLSSADKENYGTFKRERERLRGGASEKRVVSSGRMYGEGKRRPGQDRHFKHHSQIAIRFYIQLLENVKKLLGMKQSTKSQNTK